MSTQAALMAQAQALRVQADTLEALASSLGPLSASQSDEALGLKQLSSEFGFSRESLASASRDGLPVHKGAKGRIQVFRRDVESWIRSRAWEPTRAIKEHSTTEKPNEALARAESELMATIGCVTRPTKGKSAA